MRIGLITPRPGHPLLAGATALLAPRHEVRWLDPGRAAHDIGPLADVYLLKARTPGAVALARKLEERGAPVLNTAAATGLCQDREAMAALAREFLLPFAPTRSAASLAAAAAEPGLPYPLVVKSRRSRGGDLVALAATPSALRALLPRWRDEPVVVQPYTLGDGWDHKVWVIGGRLFTARRRSELANPHPAPPPGALPPGWDAVALRVGEVFALDVYGVDMIDAGGGAPLVVDVNAFPGARGRPGAPAALAALALRAAAEGAAGERAWRRTSGADGPHLGTQGA
ncbi:alpha-L-glutamate ligase [Streptomyces sp. NPDC047002]|uniref:ATP-grasp domain-containing protein n=1 Tax=Streptomyces sp. NPDC047002 TaxID=3155475 RepID=UPI003453BF1B